MVGLLLGGLLLAPVAASAAEGGTLGSRVRRGFDVAFDVGVVRPFAVLNLVAGSVLFVPAALMTSPGGQDEIEEAWEVFVVVPSQYVWGKPLGEIAEF